MQKEIECDISPSRVAWINESKCIGCTKCIQVCPVNAIIGTTRMVHTVVRKFCIGCNRCIVSCPTGCIIFRPVESTQYDEMQSDKARQNHRRCRSGGVIHKDQNYNQYHRNTDILLHQKRCKAKAVVAEAISRVKARKKVKASMLLSSFIKEGLV